MWENSDGIGCGQARGELFYPWSEYRFFRIADNAGQHLFANNRISFCAVA